MKIKNDNGTGIDQTDDRVVDEELNQSPHKVSNEFQTYDSAVIDAENIAIRNFDSPIKYSYDNNGELTMEVDRYIGSVPVGDGSTNDNYEVNVWTIEER